MLEILLIRHGQTDWNRDRRIMGRRSIPLNAVGRQESKGISQALADLPLTVVYTSPVRRALETARWMVRGRRVKLALAQELAEIDYGRWVGKTFTEVSRDENYKIYHSHPKKAKAPDGESMTDVYKRAVGFIESLRQRYKSGRVIVVSHADVIKTILVHYLGLDLNGILRIRIDNCSLSLLSFNGTSERVMAVNCLNSPGRLFGSTDQLPPPKA